MCLTSQGPNLFFGSSIQYSWGTLLCLTGIRLILYWPLDFVWSRYKRLIDWGVGSLNCFWDVSLVCIKWDVCLVGVSGWHREMCEMCDSDMCLWLTLCLWLASSPTLIVLTSSVSASHSVLRLVLAGAQTPTEILSELTKYYQVGINNHSPKWLHCIRLPSSAAAFSSQL